MPARHSSLGWNTNVLGDQVMPNEIARVPYPLPRYQMLNRQVTITTQIHRMLFSSGAASAWADVGALLIMHVEHGTQMQELSTQKAGLLQTAAMIQQKALDDFMILEPASCVDDQGDTIQRLPLLIFQEDRRTQFRELPQLRFNLCMHSICPSLWLSIRFRREELSELFPPFVNTISYSLRRSSRCRSLPRQVREILRNALCLSMIANPRHRD